MKTIYVEKYQDEETQHVYVDIDGRNYLEVHFSRGGIAGIWVQAHPLKDRLEDHQSSDLKTGEVPGIEEIFDHLIVAAETVRKLRLILVPITAQPERFLRDVRLKIAPSI